MLEGRSRRFPSRLAQLVDQLPGVHGIEEVDVPRSAGHDLEGQLASVHRTEPGGQLVWVAAVLQRPCHLEGHRLRRRRLGHLRGHPLADRSVVCRGQGVGRRRQVPAERHARATAVCAHLLHDLRVLRGACTDGHMCVVLGGRADHRGASNVNVLDAVGEVVGLGGDGLTERVQIDEHEVDGPNAMRLHVLLVLFVAACGEKAAMHFWVQGLHTAI
mmetsp:Transcript_25751/g.74077  ORF Transcript_25751/g.74077 Transcript_25751/m.74077 type:complete len:216 (-) Transcript_25751:281-928(-)